MNNHSGLLISCRTNLTAAQMAGINLSVANLSRAVLNNANLQNANLFRATIVGTQFISADLTGADMRITNSFEAGYYRAIMVRTNLSNSLLI